MRELVYSEKQISAIRAKDPNLSAMTSQWEQMFGEQVRVNKTDYGISVRPASLLVQVQPTEEQIETFVRQVVKGEPVKVVFNIELGRFIG